MQPSDFESFQPYSLPIFCIFCDWRKTNEGMLYLPVVIPILVFRVTYLHPNHDLELPHLKPAGGTLLVAYTKKRYNLYMFSIQIYPLYFYLVTIYIYAWHLDLHRIYIDM
jgi:hypothetical protein